MVTQHGVPRSRNGSTTTSTSNNNITTAPASSSTIRNSPSQTRLNGHLRAMSDASSLPSSPQRRNSLPGDTSFPFSADGEHDGDNHDHSHLDSHITFIDSLDFDSVSTVDSEERSPRVRRLCSDPRNRQPTPMLKTRRTFERRPPPEEQPYQRRAVSAQSGRSAESRPSTASSIRGEERFMEREEEEGKEKSPIVQKGKGPIMGLTMSSGRRHRPSFSADTGTLEREVEEEVTGTVGISAWRKKRIAESEAAAATATAAAAAVGTGAMGKKSVPRSLSAGDYNREGGEGGVGVVGGVKKGGIHVFEEGTNGKDRVSAEINANNNNNGSPSRITGRRVMSMSVSGTGTGNGTGTGTGTARSVSGLGLIRRNTEERSGSPEKEKEKEKGKSSLSTSTAAAASEAGRAAIAREEARAKRLRSTTVTASSPAAPDRQRSTSSAGSSASAGSKDQKDHKDHKDPKDRPPSSTSLRTNIPRPSSIPNSPIKSKLSSYGSLASPSRAKSGLTASLNSSGSPSPRHERTRSAVNPSTLQRSTSSVSSISTTSSSSSAAAVTATTPATSRLQRSNSGASATSASTSAAVAASRRDFIVRNREPPKLKSFKGGLTQPSPIQEVSQEDISRRAGMLATPDDSREETANHPPSRPSSSHSAIYSPIDPLPESSNQEQDQHQKIFDQLAALRKISRTSPPSSNRSSWSTESAEDPESTDLKPRARRRSNKHKKEDDPATASARVDEIIAEIDSLHKTRSATNSPPRLSRSKSLDDSFLRAAGDKQTTPPRPRSAGKTIQNNLVTPTKLFSPDSEMGEFTARLLRSPAVEDYEDLLAPDSDKEGDDSIHPQRERAPSMLEKHTATTSIDDLINAPRLPKEVIKREIIKTGRPRKEIIKTAIIKPRPVVKYPKRSILEDDSDDSLDYLISNDQDFSALLKLDESDSDSSSSEIELLTSNKYTPEATTQRVRSEGEAHLADREREKERAVHEKLMNRLKTLQLEVRSATRGIEVLEQWLKSPNDSDASTNSDIMEHINEHEALLLRLRAKQREKLELRVLEKEGKRSRWPKWLRWVCIALIVALFWYSVESAIFYHRLPPKYSSVPYQIRPLPQWGTRPTRAIISTVVNITQLPVLIIKSTYILARFLLNGLILLWGYLFVAFKLVGGFVVNGAFSYVKSALKSAVNRMGGLASGAVGAVQGIAEKVHAGVPVGGVEVDVGAAAEGMGGATDWMQAGTGDAWEVPGVGSDQVI